MSKPPTTLLPTEDAGDHRHGGARAPLELRVHVLDDHGRDDLLLSHDWSTHGLFLRTRHPLPVGTVRHLKLSLPGTHAPIELVARVVRVIPFGDPSGHAPGMALAFDEVPRALQLLLTDTLGRMQLPLRMPPPGQKAKPVLIVGTNCPARVTLALALDAAGCDIAEVETEVEALRLLSSGYVPTAAIFREDDEVRATGPLLLQWAEADAALRPHVVVSIGGDLSMLAGPPVLPVVVLPTHSSVDHVKAALAFCALAGDAHQATTLAEESLELAI